MQIYLLIFFITNEAIARQRRVKNTLVTIELVGQFFFNFSVWTP